MTRTSRREDVGVTAMKAGPFLMLGAILSLVAGLAFLLVPDPTASILEIKLDAVSTLISRVVGGARSATRC